MSHRGSWRSVHAHTVEVCGPGCEVGDPRPGDFILTHGKSWTSRLIRFGERLRYRGADRKYARWNHAAIFVDAQGNIVEALGAGVQQRNISVYKNTEYHVVRLENVVDEERRHECEFAMHCLHDRYGYLTIVSIGLSLLTGSKFGFGVDGQEICSALVARCLERTGEIFPLDPWHIMPADLAKYFQVEPPAPDVSKGSIPDQDAGVQIRSSRFSNG